MANVEEGFVDVSHAQDGGLLKKILVDGSGDDCPPVGSTVQVHYVGTLHADGSKFDSSRDRPGNFSFDVGVGQVIKGWDQGICTMKRGEKAILRCTSDYAYGDQGSPPKIPGGATLNFEVELFSWKEKVKPADEMTAEERVEFATKMKEAGTEAFKQQDWATAINRYEDGAEYITYNPDEDGAGGGSVGDVPKLGDSEKALALALLNNCAMARLKMSDADGAKFDCTKALQFDAENVKALYRRAEAELAMQNFAACGADLGRLLQIEPQNKAAEQLRLKAQDAERKAKKQEKAMYSKMFG